MNSRIYCYSMLFSYGITLLILCPLVFLASFIDSIAGGGGLISLPAYIAVGLPIHTAGGTNKFASSIGTLTAAINYIRCGAIDLRAAVSGGIAALAGAFLGTKLALCLAPDILQICLLVILPVVGIVIFTSRGLKERQTEKPMNIYLKTLYCILIGLILGCYDGFFGPGTGMFMTLCLTFLVKLNLIRAAGTTRILNFSSNIASMLTWLINGKVLLPIAVPCMLCSVAGGFLGSKLAIKIGGKFIKPVLAFVALLLFVKIIIDMGKSNY